LALFYIRRLGWELIRQPGIARIGLMFPSVALKNMTEITDRTTTGEPSRYRVLVICNDSDYFLRHRLYLVTHLVSVGVDVTVITGGPPIAAERIQG
jgi:hypothetical protein